MISFHNFPKSADVTYTIIPKYQAGELRTALELAGETNWSLRTCSSRDKSMLKDIEEHLPAWFDARYSVLVSHFEPEYLKQHLDDICDDLEVEAAQEKVREEIERDYLKHHQ